MSEEIPAPEQEAPPVQGARARWARLPRLWKGVLVLGIVGIVVAASLGVPGLFSSRPTYHIIPFNIDRAYSDHQWFSELGPRMTGTEAEMQGAEYIVGQLQAAGLKNTHIEEYDLSLFSVDRAEVSLVQYGPGGFFPRPMGTPQAFTHTVDFVVQGFSGSHAWSSFRDDISVHDLGNGTDNSTWAAASGMCGVIRNDQWTASNTVLFRKAKENNLAGLAIQNNVGDPETNFAPIFKGVYFSEGETYPEIPFIMMSKKMGEDVISGAGGGSKLRFNFAIPKSTVKVRVAVGEVPGTEKSSKFVMVGAHMDTVYNGPGAVDNTSGTVTVLETARNLAKEKPKRTIRFAWFGGEEEGLHGSQLYAEAHAKDIKDNLLFMENCDMTNIDSSRGMTGFIGSNDNASVAHYRTISRQVQGSDARLAKYSLTVVYDPMKEGSDQAPFAEAGKKVCFSAGSGCKEYHTYLDNITHINSESEALFGKVIGTYAYYLAENG
jgi:aminopeptidase YwaD